MSWRSQGYTDIAKYTEARKRYRAGELGRIAHQRDASKWIAKNPEKARAHQILHYAIKSGKILKQPCAICKSEKVHGHHNDYSKPLEVEWLCHTHHFEKHQQEERVAI